MLFPVGILSYFGVINLIQGSVKRRKAFIQFWEKQRASLSKEDFEKKIPWDYSVKTKKALLDPEMKSLRKRVQFLESTGLERVIGLLITIFVLRAMFSLSIQNWL